MMGWRKNLFRIVDFVNIFSHHPCQSCLQIQLDSFKYFKYARLTMIGAQCKCLCVERGYPADTSTIPAVPPRVAAALCKAKTWDDCPKQRLKFEITRQCWVIGKPAWSHPNNFSGEGIPMHRCRSGSEREKNWGKVKNERKYINRIWRVGKTN